jgi:hypothetical protein
MQILVLSFFFKGIAARDEEEARTVKGDGGKRQEEGEVRKERGKGDVIKERRKRERGRRLEGREKMGKKEEE